MKVDFICWFGRKEMVEIVGVLCKGGMREKERWCRYGDERK